MTDHNMLFILAVSQVLGSGLMVAMMYGRTWLDAIYLELRHFDLETRWFFRRWLEKLRWAVARLLPRWLVYMAGIRMMTHATTGSFGNTDVADVRAMTVLRRWELSNE
jgi:hypothetical protein